MTELLFFIFLGYLCGSDSVIDVSTTGSSGSRGKMSSVGSDDIPMLEPPGTPPPPYASSSLMHICPSDEMDENYSTIMDDVSARFIQYHL